MSEQNIQTHAGCACHADHDRNTTDIDLFSHLQIRGVHLKNRIVMSPMCQYSAQNGYANDWHFVHLGSRAIGGAGLIFVEATAVTPEGRISPFDLGLWEDGQIEPLARIVQFLETHQACPAIQIAHAGRKGSCDAPWKGGKALRKEEGGWDVIAPSPLAFEELIPQELDQGGINRIKNAFLAAAKRAVKAGFKIIEIHAAHGYLLHEFMSPLTNQRTDQYGGSLENRIRLTCEIAHAIRQNISQEMPLFVRISGTDWVENGWDVNQSIFLAKKLKELGVDLIDVSSGGIIKKAKIPIEKNYQVPLAEAIKEKAEIKTGAVGLITEPQQANEIITSGKADLVFIGRELLREPYWSLKASQTLEQVPSWPTPYGYAVKKH